MKKTKNNGSYFYAGWEAAKDYFKVGKRDNPYYDLEEANKWREYWRDFDNGIFEPEINSNNYEDEQILLNPITDTKYRIKNNKLINSLLNVEDK